MAKKISFLLFILLIPSFLMTLMAKEEQVMQIIANKIDQNGTVITATGDILIFSPNYYITAQKIVYDKNNSTMNLYENVHIVKDQQTVTIANYAFLDMKNEINSATPVLLIDKSSNLWISAKNIEKNKDLNSMKNATLSSCDCINPSWSIGFSSGDFNTSTQWINTYNNTLYIHDIPAWYFLIPAIPYATAPTLVVSYMLVNLPYMGFSTNTTRKSGLLIPQFGFGQKDGWLYAQPIYYAPRDDVDFEYIPKIRHLRGNGHELKFRYADSIYSKIEFNGGIFNEKDSYYKEENLVNQRHIGWNLKYDRSKLFSNEDSSDGLYLYLQDMNDVDYLNTKYDSKDQLLYADKILESKAKYFYNTQSYNFNAEVDHYNDISYTNGIENNDKTVMQVEPAVGIHKYSDSLFVNNLRDMIDIKYKNQTREIGLGAETLVVLLPFRYTHNLFDNYLLFTYEKEFGFNYINYLNNSNQQFKNGELLTTNDSVSLEIDLLKPFDSKIHSISFNTKYSKPRDIKKDGDIYRTSDGPSVLSIFPYVSEVENINLSFNQSLFNKENLQTIFNHKINQKITYDQNGTSNFDNLENELTFYLPYTSLSNRLLYNHDEKIVVNSISSFKFAKDNYFTDLDYSYSFDRNTTSDLYKDSQKVEAITGHIGTKVLKYYTLSYKEQYDLTKHISKFKEYELKIDKKCWGLDLSFQNTLVATATNTNSAKRQNIIYATITLKPILSFSQKFIQSEREE